MRRAWPWVIAALFPGALLWLILRFGVDVPFWDQWEIARLFQALDAHQLRLRDLLAQHNEHRILIPRLIFLGLGKLTHWNIRAELVAAWLLACLNFLLLHRIIRRTTGDAGSARLHALLLSPVFFGLVQYENWTWGFQLQQFIPPACLLGSLCAIGSRLSLKRQVAVALTLSTVSTWTLANGILNFVLLPPVLIALHWPAIKARLGVAGVWAAVFALNAVFYFNGYVRPANQPVAVVGLDALWQAGGYLLAYLGAPFAAFSVAHPIGAAQLAGGALLSAFCACALATARPRADSATLRAAAPWLVLGLTAVAGALATTAGRAGYGVDQALSPRYTTAATMLGIADWMLIWLVTRRFGSRASALPLGLILAASLASSYQRYSIVPFRYFERLQAKSILAWSGVLDLRQEIARYLYSEVESLRASAGALDRQALLRPPRLTSRNIDAIAGPVDPARYGSIVRSGRIDEFLDLRGWAALPLRHEPADVVLICYEAAGEPAQVHALATLRSERPEIAARIGRKGLDYFGWHIQIPLAEVPPEVVRISAYGFDCLSNRAYRLGGDVDVDALRRAAPRDQ